jgi:hypothetical protein
MNSLIGVGFRHAYTGCATRIPSNDPRTLERAERRRRADGDTESAESAPNYVGGWAARAAPDDPIFSTTPRIWPLLSRSVSYCSRLALYM